MKKIIRKFYPILFGLALLLLYMLIYPLPKNSENYSTALSVFFTALGSSALIIFHRHKDGFLFYMYPVISIGFPFFSMFFLHLFETLEQKVIIGIQVTALVMLIIFIAYLLKKE